jgi:hypothetical protein
VYGPLRLKATKQPMGLSSQSIPTAFGWDDPDSIGLAPRPGLGYVICPGGKGWRKPLRPNLRFSPLVPERYEVLRSGATQQTAAQGKLVLAAAWLGWCDVGTRSALACREKQCGDECCLGEGVALGRFDKGKMDNLS